MPLLLLCPPGWQEGICFFILPEKPDLAYFNKFLCKTVKQMNPIHINKTSLLVLRILGSLIFIAAGLNHLTQPEQAVRRLETAQLGYLATWMAPAEILIILSGLGLLAGGILLLAGFKTRLAAAGLLLLLVPITLTIQVANAESSGPLFKNIALIGILIFFIANGAVHYGLDQWLNKHKTKHSTSGLSKHLVMIGAFMLMLTSCTALLPANAVENAKGQAKNYAVLISQPNHLKAAAHTAETITPGSPYRRENFIVMACAKSVEAFVKGSNMEGEIEKGRDAGVQYKVCGMSLKQFNVSPAALVDGVEIIPNGLTYMFDLQQQGYATVEL
jgi:uncharacterized membrane protein YphA (DoxX/SURF4 family)/intracellular sulfur oxidation DsrE/DsrF family protein